MKDILDMFSTPVEVEYRMRVNDDDIFVGLAEYMNGKLSVVTEEDDIYTLDDEYVDFRYRMCNGYVALTVWEKAD